MPATIPAGSARPTTADQADLCRRARGGDRAAADALALAVWPGVREKAGAYARRWGLDADDLEAVGLGRLPHAIRSYDPAAGGFFNYFIAAACRKMVEWCRREARRERPADPAALGNLSSGEEPAAAAAAAAAREKVRGALAALDPAVGSYVRHVAGYEEAQLPRRAAAAAAGLLPAFAGVFASTARAELARHLPEYAP